MQLVGRLRPFDLDCIEADCIDQCIDQNKVNYCFALNTVFLL